MTRLAAALALLAAPALAQTQVPPTPDAALALAQSFVVEMDVNKDGDVSSAELVAFSDEVFDSLDTDGSNTVTVDEFQDWEFGFSDVADFRGREQAYNAVIAFVHDIFDLDNDGHVTRDEHNEGILRSRDYSDLNRDGRVDNVEFLRNFIYPMAIRTALAE